MFLPEIEPAGLQRSLFVDCPIWVPVKKKTVKGTAEVKRDRLY